ncbi:hypothetical protein ACLB2K_003974 [Fragaria x ananassa]
MRFADSGAVSDADGDPVKLLSTIGGRTIKGGVPGDIVLAGIGIQFRSNKQDQFEKRENTDLKKEQGEKVRAARSERRMDAVAMSGGGGWMRALESVVDAWIGSGSARCWRSSGGIWELWL